VESEAVPVVIQQEGLLIYYFVRKLNDFSRRVPNFWKPHILKRIGSPASAWISSYFSAQRSLERARTVYAVALQAYEELVSLYFPKFAARLKHFAVLPVRIHGILIPEAESDHSGRNPFSCRFEPLPRGSQNQISFELGSETASSRNCSS
jgi:hypothetical protein